MKGRGRWRDRTGDGGTVRPMEGEGNEKWFNGENNGRGEQNYFRERR